MLLGQTSTSKAASSSPKKASSFPPHSKTVNSNSPNSLTSTPISLNRLKPLLGRKDGEPMTNPPPPARLFVLLASNSPVGVILRRGPTDWVQMIKWHTDTDKFEEGQ